MEAPISYIFHFSPNYKMVALRGDLRV